MIKLNWHKLSWRTSTGGGGRDKLKITPNPYRDWRRLISAWVILVVVIFLSHYWLWRQLSKLDLPPAPTTDPVARLSRFEANLLKTASQLKQREQNFQTLLQNPPVIADPAE